MYVNLCKGMLLNDYPCLVILAWRGLIFEHLFSKFKFSVLIFAHFRGNAQKSVCAKICTNKVYSVFLVL